jgi:hypothetical protein
VARELSDYFRPPDLGWQPRRVLGAAALAVALLVAAGFSLYEPENLARDKPAEASSSAFDTKPRGAVDGFRYGQLGFHSREEKQPWLRIDLGGMRSLRGVTAFGRADCCFNQSLPLVLELSRDGEHFEPVARRVTPFSQFEPWEAKLYPPPEARYVRLRSEKRGFLVLSEVEVYGR